MSLRNKGSTCGLPAACNYWGSAPPPVAKPRGASPLTACLSGVPTSCGLSVVLLPWPRGSQGLKRPLQWRKAATHYAGAPASPPHPRFRSFVLDTLLPSSRVIYSALSLRCVKGAMREPSSTDTPSRKAKPSMKAPLPILESLMRVWGPITTSSPISVLPVRWQ